MSEKRNVSVCRGHELANAGNLKAFSAGASYFTIGTTGQIYALK